MIRKIVGKCAEIREKSHCERRYMTANAPSWPGARLLLIATLQRPNNDTATTALTIGPVVWLRE